MMCEIPMCTIGAEYTFKSKNKRDIEICEEHFNIIHGK